MNMTENQHHFKMGFYPRLSPSTFYHSVPYPGAMYRGAMNPTAFYHTPQNPASFNHVVYSPGSICSSYNGSPFYPGAQNPSVQIPGAQNFAVQTPSLQNIPAIQGPCMQVVKSQSSATYCPNMQNFRGSEACYQSGQNPAACHTTEQVCSSWQTPVAISPNTQNVRAHSQNSILHGPGVFFPTVQHTDVHCPNASNRKSEELNSAQNSNLQSAISSVPSAYRLPNGQELGLHGPKANNGLVHGRCTSNRTDHAPNAHKTHTQNLGITHGLSGQNGTAGPCANVQNPNFAHYINFQNPVSFPSPAQNTGTYLSSAHITTSNVLESSSQNAGLHSGANIQNSINGFDTSGGKNGSLNTAVLNALLQNPGMLKSLLQNSGAINFDSGMAVSGSAANNTNSQQTSKALNETAQNTGMANATGHTSLHMNHSIQDCGPTSTSNNQTSTQTINSYSAENSEVFSAGTSNSGVYAVSLDPGTYNLIFPSPESHGTSSGQASSSHMATSNAGMFDLSSMQDPDTYNTVFPNPDAGLTSARASEENLSSCNSVVDNPGAESTCPKKLEARSNISVTDNPAEEKDTSNLGTLASDAQEFTSPSPSILKPVILSLATHNPGPLNVSAFVPVVHNAPSGSFVPILQNPGAVPVVQNPCAFLPAGQNTAAIFQAV